MHLHHHSHSRGFTLLEMTIAMAVAGLLFMGVFQLISNLNQQVQDQAVARQTRAIASAAVDYARSESVTIRTVLGTGEGWQEIDFEDDGDPATALPGLQPQYLSDDVSRTNSTGQTYHVFVYKAADVDGGRIETFVMGIGAARPLTDLRLARIANLIGADGGGLFSDDDQNIQGASGGWSKPVADFPPEIQDVLSAGDLVTGSLFTDNVIDAPYLYRDPQPTGFEERNRMNTNIDMAGNNLNHVNVITGQNSAGARNLEVRGETISLMHPDYTGSGCAPGIPCGFAATMLDVTGRVQASWVDSTFAAALKGGGAFSGQFRFGCGGELFINCNNPTAQIDNNGDITGTNLLARTDLTVGRNAIIPTIQGNTTIQGDATVQGASNLNGNVNIQGTTRTKQVIIETCGAPTLPCLVTNGRVQFNGEIVGNTKVEGTIEFNYDDPVAGFPPPMPTIGYKFNGKAVFNRGVFFNVSPYGLRNDGVYSRISLEQGSWSDARLKEDIRPIDNALDSLLRIRGVYFNWKGPGKSWRDDGTKADVGLIAQEVEAVYPQLVKEGEDGFKQVNYPQLLGPVVEAMRDLKDQLNTLKAENAALRKRVEDLEKVRSE